MKNDDLSLIIDIDEKYVRRAYLFAETEKGSEFLKTFATTLNLEHGFGHGSEALGTYKPFCYVVLREEFKTK